MADLVFNIGKSSNKKPELGTKENILGTAAAVVMGYGVNKLNKRFPSKRQKAVNEIKTKGQNILKAQKSTNLTQRLGKLAVSQVHATAKASTASRAADIAHANNLSAKVQPSANDRARPFSKNVKYLGNNKGYGYGNPRFASPSGIKGVYEKKIANIASSNRAAQKVWYQVAKPTSENVKQSMDSFKKSGGMKFTEPKMPSASNSNFTKAQRVVKTLGKVAKFGGVFGAIATGFNSTPVGDATMHGTYKNYKLNLNK